MVWIYELKVFSEQFNEFNVDDDVITPMENFAGTTTDITPKNHHTWGCPVYVFGAIFQVNIYVLPKFESRSLTGI